MAQTMYHLFGYFPAPFVYGLIQQQTGGPTSKWGMIFTTFLTIPTWLVMLVASFYKPDLRDIWIERKTKLIEKYMSKHDGISEKALNDQINSFDESLSRNNYHINYPSLLGNGITESLLPGYQQKDTNSVLNSFADFSEYREMTTSQAVEFMALDRFGNRKRNVKELRQGSRFLATNSQNDQLNSFRSYSLRDQMSIDEIAKLA